MTICGPKNLDLERKHFTFTLVYTGIFKVTKWHLEIKQLNRCSSARNVTLVGVQHNQLGRRGCLILKVNKHKTSSNKSKISLFSWFTNYFIWCMKLQNNLKLSITRKLKNKFISNYLTDTNKISYGNCIDSITLHNDTITYPSVFLCPR